MKFHTTIDRKWCGQGQRRANRRRARLELERLEERTVPSVSVIEGFETGSLSAYQTALRFAPSAAVLPIAAHDGSQGLVKQDGYEWMIRNDAGTQVHQGDTVSVWVKFADVADGRAYLGFDARNSGDVHSPLSDGGTLAVVLAANSNQLLIQKEAGSNGVASFGDVATTAQTYQANHWYRLEAAWGAGNAITARLYDSDGVTQLSSVSGTTAAPFPTGGGIALRAFGHDKYFDTVVLDTGSTGTAAQRANAGGGLDQGWSPGNPPLPPINGLSGGPAPAPWAYTSTPGSGIEVQLAAFNQLQQVAIVGGVVGLAAGNNSLITGTKQVGWGDPLETPLLAQYLFRQLPGRPTQLIGASSTKHFFSSAHTDSQHLNPGENDTYGSSLNAVQSLYTDGSEIDPVTGTLHSPIDRGALSADGIVINGTRTFSSPIDLLLQANVADLDPAQNPAGTRWFLMGNLFVGGEQDVSQASRWVEVAPQFDGTTFSFSYPSGSNGQLNFRTIPGLADPGLTVTAYAPTTSVGAPVSRVQIAFDRAVDPTTFTPASITSFIGPNGPIDVTDVTLAGGLHNTSFFVTFAQQSQLGVYSLVLGTGIKDSAGNPLGQEYPAAFTIQGPQIIASTPSGDNVSPTAQTASVRLTFNEPINPATFTKDLVAVHGPNGSVAVTAVSPVAGSNNTQFDVRFAAQTATGRYDVIVLPYMQDNFGHMLDQDGDFVDGQVPDDIAALEFGITGPHVVSTAPNSTTPGQAYSLRVTFDEPMDASTFTPGQVTDFAGPSGPVSVTGIVPVSGSNFTAFDILFTPQTAAGTYNLTIGPNVRDVFGNAMDQDGDLVGGQVPADQYAATFTVSGPRVIASNPSGGTSAPVDHVRVTFDEPINAATFTSDAVAAFDPSGNPIGVIDVTEVPFTNHTQFDISFDAQRTPGTYTLTVGPGGIQDLYGNSMDGPATLTFTIQVTYTATPTAFQNIEIFGQSGTQTLVFTSGQVTADDDYGTINLGSNTFNFYGRTYNQLFPSSNGLITFGSGNSAYHATNLAGSPSQAAIAVYWTDLIKTGTEPMIVWRINGNQLIVEWYRVSIFDDSSLHMTFEAILSLNTGGSPGNIVLNYSNVSGTGDGPEDNGVTVGVKDAGTASTVGRTVVEDGTHFSSTGDPRVQTDKAVLLSVAAPAGPLGGGGPTSPAPGAASTPPADRPPAPLAGPTSGPVQAQPAGAKTEPLDYLFALAGPDGRGHRRPWLLPADWQDPLADLNSQPLTL
jgi:methionine-rich copper-binding protein CopC